MTLDDYIAAYGGLLARRRMSVFWQAERNGAGLVFGEGGEGDCLASLRAVCGRLGLPRGGEDVDMDGLSDLELALVCDCFGADAFGADPTPRLASFRCMRRFLFSRLRNHPPAPTGLLESGRDSFANRWRRVLVEDDVASFCMGRELMGEEFTESELIYLLQTGKREILKALCEDGTLEDPRFARYVADAFLMDVHPQREFDFAEFVGKECDSGQRESWHKVLLTGFSALGATMRNPAAWYWNAAKFTCRDGWRCEGFDGIGDFEALAKLGRVGFDDTFAAADGIVKAECAKALQAYREICLRCLGRISAEVPAPGSGFASEYLVVDLSSGPSSHCYPVSGLDHEPDGGWTEEFKTTKLVLRRVEPGRFTMGSPSNELGHLGDEVLREITLTKPYFIGIFEVTQRQWEMVMGKRPSRRAGATHPVENVSYDDIRGHEYGADWPESDVADAESFVGRLRERTGIDTLDLPTEAEWEYAARAGRASSLTTGG